jgi:type IV secretion system protein VirB4
MQLLPSLTRDPRIIAREKPAGAHLPYAVQRDDHTIETHDGLLMQVIKLRGLMFETADTTELNYRKTLRDAMLQSIGSSRFALYHHVIRRRVDMALSAEFPDAFSQLLDGRWRERLARRQLFVNELYLTLVRRALSGGIGIADQLRGWIGRPNSATTAGVASEMRQLDAARETLVAALSAYDPRLLSVYEGAGGVCSEPLEFLGALFNGELRPMLLPGQALADYLPQRRVSFGRNAVELGPTGLDERRFSALVSLKDYAGQTAPGMFDALLALPMEMTVTQSFAFIDRQATLGRADSPARAVEQIALLILQSGTRLDRESIAHYVRSSIDVFVQLSREGGRRIVSTVEFRP